MNVAWDYGIHLSSLIGSMLDMMRNEDMGREIYIYIHNYNIYIYIIIIYDLRSKSILFASRSQVITSFWMAWNEPREDGVLVIIDWGSLGSVLGTCTWSYKSVILGPWCHQTWNEMDGSMGKYEKKVIDMYMLMGKSSNFGWRSPSKPCLIAGGQPFSFLAQKRYRP